MKVKELIEKLKQYPEEYAVVVVDEDDFLFDVLGVSVRENEVLLTMDSPVFGVDPTEYASNPSQ